MSTFFPNRARLLLAAVCFACSGSLCAQDAGFTPSAYLGVVHDSNVFRLEDDTQAQALLGTTQRSDLILQYGAGLAVRLPISQQEVAIDLDAIRNQYDRFGFLDHTALDARAGWAWVYGRRWNGDLRLRYREDISSFEELRRAARDERTFYEMQAGATRRLTPRWDFGATLAHTGLEYDLPPRRTLDRRIDLARAELALRGSGESRSRAGLQSQVRRVSFPNRETIAATAVDNTHVEYELSTNVDWEATFRSRLTAKLGYARLRHDEFSVRDFSGITALGKYHYRFTERTGVEASAWRDINVRSETDASYVRDTGFGLRPFWEYSPRTTFDGFLSWQERRFEGDPRIGVTAVDTRRDRLTVAEIAAAWERHESLVLRLALRAESRDSNRADREYSYYSVAGNVRLAF